MELLKLPNEIFLMILGLLDLEDQLNLSLSSRGFHFIRSDDGICKMNLQNHASFSPEFQEAKETGQYARAWRQITKRKIAIQTANPFLVSIVAVADRFIYKNGALLYTAGQEHLRILCLQGSVTTERALDPQNLLQSIEPFDPAWGDYRLSPLHYSCGIVSLLAQDSTGAGRDYLITLKLGDGDNEQIQPRAYPLATSHKLFIRNDKNYLYYGVRSYTTSQNPGCWTIREIDINTGAETKKPLELSPPVGEEIGSNACFEIFDGYLYGVFIEQIYYTEPESWNSFYRVFRLSLGNPEIKLVDRLDWLYSWRRHANEGTTDDRWSSLELSQDEKTGGIFIYETRKEWSPQAPCSQRNCYRKEISFGPEDDMGMSPFADSPESEPGSENYIEDRLPGSVHNGDSGSQISVCTYMDSPIRSYNATARSFVDLVNDPTPDSVNRQQLRLRIRPMRKTSDFQTSHSSLTGGEAFKGDSDIKIWPPESPSRASETELHRAFSLMNPEPLGRMKDWTTDEKSVIYSIGQNGVDSPSPVILISFDPGLRFLGLPKVVISKETDGDYLQVGASLPRVINPEQGGVVAKVQPLYSFLQGNRPPLGLDLTF